MDRQERRKKINHMGGRFFLSVYEDERSCYEAVMDAVENDGMALEYSPFGQKHNYEIVKAAVTNNGNALQYAQAIWKYNSGIVNHAVSNCGTALKYADDLMKNNGETVKCAVKQDGLALEYASARLRSDEAIVREAVKNKGLALRYASEELRDYEDIVKEAVTNDWSSLQYASERLRDNKRIVKEAVKNCGLALQYASERLKENEAIVREAVKNNGWAFKYASAEFRNSYELAKLAVKNSINAGLINIASEEIRNNADYMKELIKINGACIDYAGNNQKRDAYLKLLSLENRYATKGETLVSNPEWFQDISSVYNPDTGKMVSIEDIVRKHKVKYLVHFTNIENLDNILKNGLQTRTTLEQGGNRFVYSDANRLDGMKDTISLSISAPYEEMFSSKRKHGTGENKWCVLLIDKSILWEKKNLFYAFNAAGHEYKETLNEARTGVIHFASMFAGSKTQLPYAMGAEVMCKENIEPSYIKACIFDDGKKQMQYDQLLEQMKIQSIRIHNFDECDADFIQNEIAG